MPQARCSPEAELTLRLEWIEPERNRRRYYELTLGRSLFYEAAREANALRYSACAANEVDEAARAANEVHEAAREANALKHSACAANEVDEAAGKADALDFNPLPITLTRRWGRIGRPGRERVELHRSLAEAAAAFHRWRRAKERRGYATVGQAS